MQQRRLVISLCVVFLARLAVAEEFSTARLRNWHQWRGPLATGVTPQGDPPLKWDEETNIKWKYELPGEGSSTPIVWNDQVFVLAAVKTDRKAENPPQPHATAKTRPPEHYYRFVVLSVDRETGKLLWQRTACEEVPHEGRHFTHTYAGSSPITDGRFVYASFGSRGVYCYDMDGKLQWKRDLGDMRTRYGWGEATSPALHGETLIVNWDHEDDSFIVALDARRGETKWRVARDEPTSWATPLVVEHAGGTQVIVNGTNRVRSYDLASGKVLWECGGQTVNAIPSPVRAGDFVVCMSGYRGSAACAIPLDSSGDVTDTGKLLWSRERGTPYVPSPLLYGDLLYFTRRNNGVLSCLDVKTGEPVIDHQRLPPLRSLYASPAGAAGRVYIPDRDGATLVLKHGREFEVLALNKLDDPIDASPAIVGKQLFLRGATKLYCIQAE